MIQETNRARATRATRSPKAGKPPVALVFGGWQPDLNTVDVSMQAAGALGSHSRRIDSCEVLVTREGPETEIRIDLRAAEGEVLVDHVAPVSSRGQLHAALRDAFARVAHGLDEARQPRGRTANGAGDRSAGAEPPPCVWHG